MKSNVGSKRMLPYRRNRYLREGAYDEPKELAGVDRGSSASLFESEQAWQEADFRRICCLHRIPSQVCHSSAQAWAQAQRAEEAGAQETISRGSGRSAHPHLGDLWADLLKTAQALPARDGERPGASPGIGACAGSQIPTVANEPGDHRPVLETSPILVPIQPRTWDEWLRLRDLSGRMSASKRPAKRSNVEVPGQLSIWSSMKEK